MRGLIAQATVFVLGVDQTHDVEQQITFTMYIYIYITLSPEMRPSIFRRSSFSSALRLFLCRQAFRFSVSATITCMQPGGGTLWCRQALLFSTAATITGIATRRWNVLRSSSVSF